MAKYVVKLGNNLTNIARDFGVTVPDLQAWNEAEYPSLANNPNDIQIGWKLRRAEYFLLLLCLLVCLILLLSQILLFS